MSKQANLQMFLPITISDLDIGTITIWNNGVRINTPMGSIDIDLAIGDLTEIKLKADRGFCLTDDYSFNEAEGEYELSFYKPYEEDEEDGENEDE